jgi:hypothetical protein
MTKTMGSLHFISLGNFFPKNKEMHSHLFLFRMWEVEPSPWSLTASMSSGPAIVPWQIMSMPAL